MNAIPVITLILTIVGFVIVCYFTFKVKDEEAYNINTTNIEECLKKLNESMSDADTLVNTLDSFSENIKQDLDKRHDEILNLHTMINEKKLEILELFNLEFFNKEEPIKEEPKLIKDYQKNVTNDLEMVLASESSLLYQKADSFSKSEEIISLFNKGFPIAEIAKKLNIGFGEVKLIVDLKRKQAVLWLIKEVILLG